MKRSGAWKCPGSLTTAKLYLVLIRHHASAVTQWKFPRRAVFATGARDSILQRVRQFETRLADTTTDSLGLKFGMDTQCLPRAQSDRMNPSVVQRRLLVPSGKREVGRRRDCRDSREVKVQQARIKPDNDLSGRTSSSGRTSDSGLCGIILQGMVRTS